MVLPHGKIHKPGPPTRAQVAVRGIWDGTTRVMGITARTEDTVICEIVPYKFNEHVAVVNKTTGEKSLAEIMQGTTNMQPFAADWCEPPARLLGTA